MIFEKMHYNGDGYKKKNSLNNFKLLSAKGSKISALTKRLNL